MKRGFRSRNLWPILLLCLAVVTPGTASSADNTDSTAMEEVLDILRAQGVIDDATRERVLAKHVADQKQSASVAAGILDGMQWYGDLRLRHESTFFDTDSLGTEQDNRYRFRYRARFGFKKKVNDSVTVGFRLASGTGDARSTNQTLGGNNDFQPDGIFFDRAWVDLKLTKRDGFSARLVAGKVPNPYTWKNGKDPLIFDGDLNMEGGYLQANWKPSEGTEVFSTLGSFLVRELKTNADPKLFAAQIGGTMEVGNAKLGLRVSGYEWRSLDSGFISAAKKGGNLDSAFDSRARMGSTFAFVDFFGGSAWPMRLYGTFVRNFTADSAVISGVSVDEEEDAFGIGLEAGDSKKFARIGAGYFRVEANSVVGQFTDSDLFDGMTNRKGFVVYMSRRIAKNTDFKLTFFDSDDVEDTLGASGPFQNSLGNADRQLLQADVVVKF